MISPQFISTTCNQFYDNVQSASDAASEECHEWRAAIDLEKAGLARACNDNISDTVDDSIDSFQHNVWGMVGLDHVDWDRPVELALETDSLESFENTL